MSGIPEFFLDRLRESVRIEDIIRARTPLKKAGADYKGLCPFHKEKTPSFHVSPVKQFFHCFGCNTSGDVIKFVMDFDKVGFVEAVESLAATAGLSIPKTEQKQDDPKEIQYLSIHEQAAAFYRHALLGSESAQAYLNQRGISAHSVDVFGLGLAQDAWDGLGRFLMTRDHRTEALIDSGLCVQKDPQRPPFDRFRRRLMFPIQNRRGQVVAFGGRILPGQAVTEHADAPKYLNSPETLFFQKSQMLYGLPQALPALRKTSRATVVEGYTDVILLHQHGYTDAVAPLGTAFTGTQLSLLWGLVDHIVVCFDGDAAGMRAAQRCVEMALPDLRAEKTIGLMMLDAGEDPASLMSAGMQARWQQLSQKPLSIIDFWLLIHQATFNGTVGHDRAALLKNLLSSCDAIRDLDLRTFYKQEIRNRFYQQKYSSFSRTKSLGVRGVVLPSPKNNLDRACCALFADLIHHPEWFGDAAEILGQVTFANPSIESLRANVVAMAVEGLDKDQTTPYINQSLRELDLWQSDPIMPHLFSRSSHESYPQWRESCMRLHSTPEKKRGRPLLGL